MNYLLNRQGAKRYAADLPEGLNDLLADISREVLRKQPASDEIYKFIADYLDALIVTRESTSVSKEILDNVVTSSLTIVDILEKNGLSYKKSKMAAEIIQRSFKEFIKLRRMSTKEELHFREHEVLQNLVSQCHLNQDEIFAARGVLRKSFKEFCQKFMTLKKGVESFSIRRESIPGISDKKVDEIFVKSLPSIMALNSAALKIQTAYRRYSAKSILLKKRKSRRSTGVYDHAYRPSCPDLPSVEEPDGLKKRENAAITIQANFRGFQARKKLKETLESEVHMDTESINQEAPVRFLKRDGYGMEIQDQIVNALKEFTDDIVDNLEFNSKRDYAAKKIQASFRIYKKRKYLEMDKAAKKIQTMFREHKARKKSMEKKEIIPNISRQELLEKMNQAATKIQATFKGHMIRKDLHQQNNAAKIIQINFRKFQSRKFDKYEEEEFDPGFIGEDYGEEN